MDTKVSYCKGGKKNGYSPAETFDHPSDWENEYSDEDEIYVESPNLDLSSATKPLMYPRARTKVKGRGSHCRCRPIVHAVCCFIFLVLTLGSLMGLVIYYVNKHDSPPNNEPSSLGKPPSSYKFVMDKPEVDYSNIVGCDRVDVEDVWVIGFPKLLTESAFRLLDVNADGVLDIILGFATGADGMRVPKIVCDIYFDGKYPCHGGLLALEGATGRELWRHYSEHELYGINCGADLNNDGVNDCLAGGRAGTFQAVSGKDGALIWDFGKQEAKNEIMNLYTAQLVGDLDQDGTVDVLAVHGGDPLQDPGSAYRLSGRIILMSGRTGEVIRWVGVPDNKESYYSPQLYTLSDGEVMVLFGTGGETHGGALWRIRLSDLVHGHIDKAVTLFSDLHKGVMTPPALADITGDGVQDIIIPVFNSSVVAIDGQTLKVIWNYTFPMSESYSTPAPGFYNDDDIPDFLVKYAFGPGFPVYYHSSTTILDGRTGLPLIDPPIKDTVGAQASPVTVSMEGRGNDVFLYWTADCSEHDGEGGEYKFVKGTNVHEQSRSDFCKLRFKTSGYSKVNAVSRHIKAPGTAVYFSDERVNVEHSVWVNTTKEGLDYVLSHPEYLQEYRQLTSVVTNPFQKDEPEFFPKEGNSESLFETPVLDQSERTSYKKGPGQYRLPLLNHRSDIDLPDNDYDSPYYTDDIDGYPDSAYQRGRTSGRADSYPGYRGSNIRSKYYPTTPDYYSKSRYRQRYPTDRRGGYRKGRISERNAYPNNSDKTKTDDNSVNDNIKHIAMRDTRYKKSKQIRDGVTSNSYRHKRAVDYIHRKSKRHHRRDEKRKSEHSRKRMRRHVGPHDEKGLQRLLSTGSLAPTTLPKDHPKFNHSIDFVFATYWFFPAQTRAILPEDQKCIEKKMSEETIRFDPKSQYYGMDHDAYEHSITDECLTSSAGGLPDTGQYENQDSYNPFNIHMGQMTVYRVRLTCTCTDIPSDTANNSKHNTTKRCGHVLPFDQQQWYGYMGNNADSLWHPRRPV